MNEKEIQFYTYKDFPFHLGLGIGGDVVSLTREAVSAIAETLNQWLQDTSYEISGLSPDTPVEDTET